MSSVVASNAGTTPARAANIDGTANEDEEKDESEVEVEAEAGDEKEKEEEDCVVVNQY